MSNSGVEFIGEEGIPVTLPSGGTYHVMSNTEKAFFTDKAKRYLDEFHYTNISDLSDVDKLVIAETNIHRWSIWVSKGKDYFDEEISPTTYQRMINDTSNEVRQLKKNLGMDKVTRDKVSGDDSLPSYWDALLRRAKEFGYMRNEQAVQAINSMMRIDALVTLHKNTDEAERREFHAEWDDILQLISEELEKFHQIDTDFRQNVQRYWIRSM